MAVVGITGHQNLPAESITYIRRALQDVLRSHRPLVGLSALAEGSDQLFAEIVLALDGTLVAVVPAHEYIDTFAAGDAQDRYVRLLARAREVVSLPFEQPTEEAFFAAGREVVDRAELLVAVWDGELADGLGGTADVVDYARERGLPTIIIWPEGVTRR